MMSDSNSKPTGRMSVFSGRPDPRWTMSNDDWNELNQLIETLSGKVEKQGTFQEPSILGYRGFEGSANNDKIYYVARTKQVVKARTNSFFVYDDPTKSVETWFVKNAEKNGVSNLPTPEN